MVKKLLGTLARYGYKAGVHPVPKETNQYRDFRYMVVTDNETWGSSTRKEADELWKGLQQPILERFENFITEGKIILWSGMLDKFLKFGETITWYRKPSSSASIEVAVNADDEDDENAPHVILNDDGDTIGFIKSPKKLHEAFIAPRKLGDFTRLGWKLGVHARPEQGGKPMYPDFNFFVVAPGESWGTVTKKEADELSKRLNESTDDKESIDTALARVKELHAERKQMLDVQMKKRGSVHAMNAAAREKEIEYELRRIRRTNPEVFKPGTLKPLNEDAPAMAAGNGGVAGLGVGPQGEPGVRKKRKGPDGTFAGADVFETDMDALHKSRFGKNRYHRYSRYVGEDDKGEDIRQHGRTTKNDIILKDSRTGAMTYLRKKQK